MGRYVGIVLSQMDYKDNDALISFLSKETGRITLIAKGIRKPSSKNVYALQPYTTVELIMDYEEGKTLFSFKSAVSVKNRRKLYDDLKRMSVAQVISEAINAMDEQEDSYELVEFCLDRLMEDKCENVLALFLGQLLNILGIQPECEECVFCGNKKIKGFSVADGGFVCGNCSNAEEDINVLRRMRLLNHMDIAHYSYLGNYGDFSEKELDYLNDFLDTYSGIHLKSYSFLQSL